MDTRMYLVGGSVRDRLLGKACNDFDFAVEAESYDAMMLYLKKRGMEVYKELPEFVTVRGRIPLAGCSWPPAQDYEAPVLIVPADFTLCREEAMYTDMRHPSVVTPTSLEVDLSRRDFTMNAIAQDGEGNYIDPFNGRHDIDCRIIRCVGDPYTRFSEDPLRMLRALRFSVVLDFRIEHDTSKAIRLCSDLLRSLPVERVQTELMKMCKHDWFRTMRILDSYPMISNGILAYDRLWFKPTTEER